MGYIDPIIKVLVVIAMLCGTFTIGREILTFDSKKFTKNSTRLEFIQEQQLFNELETLETEYYKTNSIEEQRSIRLRFISKVKAYSPDYLPVDLQVFYGELYGRDH